MEDLPPIPIKVKNFLIFSVTLMALVLPVFGQLSATQAQSIETILEVFGRQQYSETVPQLEAVVASEPKQAPLTYYYLGESYYQIGDQAKARTYLEKAFETPFSKQEACWRLAEIARKRGDQKTAEHYEQTLARIVEALKLQQPDMRLKPGQSLRSFAGGHIEIWAGDVWMLNDRLDEAIKAYEFSLTINVKLEHRFVSPVAALLYKRLTEAYGRQVEQLEKGRARAEELAEARMFMRHYSLRLHIIESRIGKDWIDRVSLWKSAGF